LDLPSTFCFFGSAGLEESNFLFPRFFCPHGNKEKKSARDRKEKKERKRSLKPNARPAASFYKKNKKKKKKEEGHPRQNNME